MKNWIVFKRKYEGSIHGAMSKEEWNSVQMFAANTVEFVADADTQEEALDMAEGFDAMARTYEL